MAEITRTLAANIRRQFLFVVTTTASTRYLVQNFQLTCYSQRVNAMSLYNNCGSSTCSKMAERSDGCSDEILLAFCTRKRRLEIKMTENYYWIGVQENIGMFSKGGFPVMAETTRKLAASTR